MNRIQSITIAIIAVLLVLPCGCGYNTLQGLDEEVKAAWSEVQNQYQRRFDLIPNLVATVKGYAAHEEETLTKVVEARAKIAQMKISPEIIQNPGPEPKCHAADLFNGLVNHLAHAQCPQRSFGV